MAASAFGPQLGAAGVAEAIVRGLSGAGVPSAEALLLTAAGAGTHELGWDELLELLAIERFDERVRAARALIVAQRCLLEPTLVRSVAFELATRARQAGVPAYAVTAGNRLDSFDARILDLQAIVVADSSRSLTAAGRRLAALL